VTYSDDADAAWLRKGNKAYYGYKKHVVTDSRDGFVLGGHVTPANHSDVKELPRLLQDVPLPPGGVVFADKGYSSRANREQLVRNGFCDGIMSKAHRGLPLSRVERRVNLLISSVRTKVERAFGTFKRKLPPLPGQIPRPGQGGTGIPLGGNGLQPEKVLGNGQIGGGKRRSLNSWLVIFERRIARQSRMKRKIMLTRNPTCSDR